MNGTIDGPGAPAAGESAARHASLHATRARLTRVAWWLDSGIAVPGTSWRIGAESLIGLIPGVGDAAGAVLGSYFVVEALRLRAPGGLVVRMVGNVAFDMVLGVVPVVGDIADFAFKSNSRNLRLLNTHLDGELGLSPAAPERRVARTLLRLVFGLAVAAGIALAVWRLRGH